MTTLNTLIKNKSDEIWMALEGGLPSEPSQVITLHQWRMSLLHTESWGHMVTSAEWMEHFQNECVDVFVVRDGQVYSVTSDVCPAENWTIDEYSSTYMMVDLDEKVWGVKQE